MKFKAFTEKLLHIFLSFLNECINGLCVPSCVGECICLENFSLWFLWRREAPMYVFTITIVPITFVHDANHSLGRKKYSYCCITFILLLFSIQPHLFFHVLFGGCRTDQYGIE